MTLDRNTGQQRTALTNDLATTPVLAIGGYSGLGLFVPSGVSSTSVASTLDRLAMASIILYTRTMERQP